MKTSAKAAGGVTLIATLLLAGGCHTVEGMGRDVQALGSGIEQGTSSMRDDSRRHVDPYYGTPTRQGLDPRYDPYGDS